MAAESCRGFHWIGQSWEHCDMCGRPWHVHDGMVRPKRDVGPFSYETIIVPWADYDSKTVDDDR